jgi:DNA-binding HxlR family transcriptional regulator
MRDNGPMHNYGQYCPVAKAAEVLGDRWTLLILRDMHTGALRFNDLHRGLPGISRSVLTQRLRRLERDGLIERHRDERNRTKAYELTAAGHDLAFVLAALTHWVNRWVMDDPTPAELDPRLLLLWFSRIVDPSSFGEGRFVAEFQMTGPSPGRSWIVVEGGEVSLCLDDPCLDIDLWVTADTAALYQVFMGRQRLASAVVDNLVDITGPPGMVRAFLRTVDQTSPPYMIGAA